MSPIQSLTSLDYDDSAVPYEEACATLLLAITAISQSYQRDIMPKLRRRHLPAQLLHDGFRIHVCRGILIRRRCTARSM